MFVSLDFLEMGIGCSILLADVTLERQLLFMKSHHWSAGADMNELWAVLDRTPYLKAPLPPTHVLLVTKHSLKLAKVTGVGEGLCSWLYSSYNSVFKKLTTCFPKEKENIEILTFNNNMLLSHGEMRKSRIFFFISICVCNRKKTI